MSSNGDPGGNLNGKDGSILLTILVDVVEIKTTDGISLSAKSANEFGLSLAFPKKEKFTVKKAINRILNFFTLFLYIPNNNKPNN